MKKEEFIYNNDTLTYERVEDSIQSKIIGLIIFLVLTFLMSLILINSDKSLYDGLYVSEEERIENEILELKIKYDFINKKIEENENVLEKIHQRDVNMNRPFLNINSVDDYVWNGGTGGSEYEPFMIYKNSGEIMTNTSKRLDKLSFKIVIQSKSIDTIANIIQDKHNTINSIMSVRPIYDKSVVVSKFGMRIHPIYKKMKLHRGIDYSAPIGTPIYATGDGVVNRVQNNKNGYGKSVKISHSYDYETLYAHMSKIIVKPNQKIVKGQKIGFVGNTGTSTGPHLHYEVRYKETPINPGEFVIK